MISRILTKIGEYQKTNFVVNWASGTVILGLLVGSITLYLQNESLKETITSLKETNSALTTTVEAQGKTITGVQSSVETINNVIKVFVENPPATMMSEIDKVKFIIEQYHGNNANHVAQPEVEFEDNSNRPPEL